MQIVETSQGGELGLYKRLAIASCTSVSVTAIAREYAVRSVQRLYAERDHVGSVGNRSELYALDVNNNEVRRRVRS